MAIRNPLGVATSLLKRQSIAPATSHLLSLVYVVPYLHEIAAKPFVVADYDLLLADPRGQLLRIGQALKIPLRETDSAAIEHFAGYFINPALRHGYFSRHDFDTIPAISPLIREAYLRLYQLATDQITPDAADFWTAWTRLRKAVETIVAGIASTDQQGAGNCLGFTVGRARDAEPEVKPEKTAEVRFSDVPGVTTRQLDSQYRFSDRSPLPGTGVHLFVVIGTQRTGTHLLREILNTNEQIAMLGEILLESSAPAHWENFLRGQPPGSFPPPSLEEAEALLDRYFQFVHYRVRNHWVGGDKSGCRAIGVDIKYNQLRQLAPRDWSSAEPPFLLSYLKARGATLIHTMRNNVIHCAISAMIAAERNFWHNYEGVVIDRRYSIDVEQCLKYVRIIVADRDAFLEIVKGCKVADCCYEDLTEEIARAAANGEIPDGPGPLRDIAKALRVPFRFRYDGRLRKAINVPYFRLLLNQETLSQALRQSEFAAFDISLGDPTIRGTSF